ncbi:ATP-binding cassette domain-containing protein [Caldalkalibacillus mannanilyticus]|uniref:ATP-binding cassette domain-containing protein n=1 Tax=Caldalkalibacillus mannanilyticus TaxID=1418 RepID=UPI000A5A0816
MTDIITCQDLTKKYKDTTALDGISFALEPNKIYGLLGRNGAGKTTLLHLIHAEIRETSGRLLINGQPPYENEKVLEDLCFIKDSQNFKKSLKVKEVLELAAIFYKHWDPVYAMELIRQFNLSPSKKVKSLSKGMESA